MKNPGGLTRKNLGLRPPAIRLILGSLCRPAMKRLRRGTVRLFDDGEAHAGLVAVFFRHFAPAVLRLLARLERTFDLGRSFHELVEVHRAELTANHPEVAAFGHGLLLLLSSLNADVRTMQLEL